MMTLISSNVPKSPRMVCFFIVLACSLAMVLMMGMGCMILIDSNNISVELGGVDAFSAGAMKARLLDLSSLSKIRNLQQTETNAISETTSESYVDTEKYDFTVWLVCTISIKQSYLLLPYFIEYYLNLGINPNNVLLNLHINTLSGYNCGDNNCDNDGLSDTLRAQNVFKYIQNVKNINKIEVYKEGEFAGRKLFAENKIITKYIKSNDDYILIVDSDEFQNWNDIFMKENVNDIYEFINKTMYHSGDYKNGGKQIEYISGEMVDRFAEHARLINPINIYNEVLYDNGDVNDDNNGNNHDSGYVSVYEQYPWNCNFTKSVVKGWTGKVVLFRNVYRFHNGHHMLTGRIGYHDDRVNITYDKHSITSIENEDEEIDAGYFYEQKPFKEYESKKYFLDISHFKWNSNVLAYLTQRRDVYKTPEAITEVNNATTWFEENAGYIDLAHVKSFKCWK